MRDLDESLKSRSLSSGAHSRDPLAHPGYACLQMRDAPDMLHPRWHYANRFASGARGHAIKVVEAHAQGNGGYGLTQFTVTVPGANGNLREEHGSIAVVYRRDADGWHMRLVEPSVPESADQ
jgi:ketosteroid isomerase-like protein